MLSVDEIKTVADDVLGSALRISGFERATVDIGVDQDGEPAIFVLARFRPGAESANGKSAYEAVARLRDALRRRGEERFAFVRYDFPGDEVPAIDPVEFQS